MNERLLLVVVASLLTAGTSSATEKAHWGYSGHEGPAHWGELAPEYATCSHGKNQSPINLTGMIDGDLPELKIHYLAAGAEVVNNGHTIQVNYAPGSTISVGGKTFELKQLHFHAPSENSIEGHSYPMEAHFVHSDRDGNLAVIAVLFEIGNRNSELDKAWRQMPEQAGEENELNDMVDAFLLLPHEHAYYRFSGSLTTPPCSEGVEWLVMKFFNTASQQQIDKFAHVIHQDNNRPVQPLNARVVIK